MASESRDEGGITVELAPELDEWLTERAATQGVSPSAIVEQLLASYRTTAEMDEGETLAALFDVETAVEDAMQDELDAAVAATVDSALADRVDDRIADVQTEFQRKLEDVRERVIQVKRETDAKASADHDHEEFAQLDELQGELAGLDTELTEFRQSVESRLEDADERFADHEDRLDDVADRFDDFEDRLDDVEEKLKRVAWVVNDLRDDRGSRDPHQQAVDRIKRAAAQEGVTNATCENCDETVQIALLTDPQCPHCNTTVSDVRPEGGIFRTKARLVAAAQLEAGETDE